MKTFEEILAIIREEHEVNKKVEGLGGFQEHREQSDKLGQDWIITTLNDAVVSKVYVEQENPTGTYDNPIIYYEGCPLINNAYYLKDGQMFVYMAGEWIEW